MFLLQSDKDNKYEVIPRKSSDVKAKIDPGVYNVTSITSPWEGTHVWLTLNTRYKKGKEINTGVFKEAKEHVEFFIDPLAYESRTELGLMHKLALIFNGGPGTGKTYLAGQLMEKLVREKDAICIMSKGEPVVKIHEIIDWIRTEDPDRFIGVVIDEYEKSKGEDLDMLSFLDGTNSRDNMLLIATVNSTKRLPETIINRIGRIERVYNFDTEDTEVIKAMIESVIPTAYAETIKAEDLALEFIEYGIKPSIDFITVLVRNKVYELKSGKDSPLLLENLKKSKSRRDKKRPVGFATPNDNRGEVSEKEEQEKVEREEAIQEQKEAVGNMMKAMLIGSIINPN